MNRGVIVAAVLALVGSAARDAAAAAPVPNAPPSKSRNEGVDLSFDVSCTDADGGTVTLSLVSISPTPPSSPSLTGLFPTQIATSPVIGTFSWTASFSDAGTYTATFQCSDGGTIVQDTTTITIVDVNRAPAVTVSTPQSGTEGANLSFSVDCSDPDGAAVTLNLQTLSPTPPSSPSLTGLFPTQNAAPASGTFDWTAGFTDADTYTATFRCSDGSAQTNAPVTVEIDGSNRAPSIATAASHTINEGTELSFGAACSDADGGLVGLSLIALSPPPPSNPPLGTLFPTVAAVAPLNGVFTWTPGPSDAGDYTATLRCTDGAANDDEPISITVVAVGTDPVDAGVEPDASSGQDAAPGAPDAAAPDAGENPPPPTGNVGCCDGSSDPAGGVMLAILVLVLARRRLVH